MLPESWTHDQLQRPGVPPQLQGLYLPDPERLRDCAHLKRIRKYQIVCPNRTIGMGEHSDSTPIEEFHEVVDRCVPEAVYPASDTYRLMARLLDKIIERPEPSYSNSGMTIGSGSKRQDMTSLTTGLRTGAPPCHGTSSILTKGGVGSAPALRCGTGDEVGAVELQPLPAVDVNASARKDLSYLLSK
jgi:hypothetical protein